MWIKREFEDIISTSLSDVGSSPLKLFPIWLFLGPRQVGKSSLLRHSSEEGRVYLNLDDLNVRMRANEDPEFFLSQYPNQKLLIDEIQYAPKLLSVLKRRADETPTYSGRVWLTGSQSFEVMKGVRETLAGRVALLNLFGLSNDEKKRSIRSASDYFQGIMETTFPKLFNIKDESARSLYLSSYIETFILRDVQELVEIKKRREFELFLKMCALRTGQILDYESLSRDVGVSAQTIKQWIGVLEACFLIHLVHPYFSNRTKRLIKSPKLYFNDAGLAAFLAGWRDSEMLRLGPMGGAILETHLFGDIVRKFKNSVQDVQIHYWRTKDGQEIDFLIETRGHVYPVEIKMGAPRAKTLPILEAIAEPNWKKGQVWTLLPESAPLTQEWEQISVITDTPRFE